MVRRLHLAPFLAMASLATASLAVASLAVASLAVASLAVALTTASVSLAADDGIEIFTDPAKAGPDFQIQGEYESENGEWGAQIIALGDGKFDVVGYRGGLPGKGWEREDFQALGKGVRKGDVVTVEGEEDAWHAEIKGGVMTVYSGDGEVIGQQKKVTRKSPTLGKKPPKGATVLFDGKSADQFVDAKMTDDHLLLNNCVTKQKFGDHSFHLEFRTPFKPKARGQARGNSGVYLQSRYELQVLDSFGLDGKNNECGGIYSISVPKVNMCLPPLSWQTYDIDFTAARYDADGKKIKNARTTIRHNGVVIHDDLELTKGTPGRLGEGPSKEGIFLQGHGNPVVYRNIWVVEK